MVTACPGSTNCFNPRLRAGGDLSIKCRGFCFFKFQSTPPRGRRRSPRQKKILGNQSFNPRLRAGGDPACPLRQAVSPSFNPRLRAGGDGFLWFPKAKNLGVSIHASAREATPRWQRQYVPVYSFNPRLRAGGDFGGCSPKEQCLVSIHASAREATSSSNRTLPIAGVSIHASAREATIQQTRSRPCSMRFNPRLRAGGDLTLGGHSRYRGVSIHASAREATIDYSSHISPYLFQSTPPRGRRRLQGAQKSV